jgi:hypothetical protein
LGGVFNLTTFVVQLFLEELGALIRTHLTSKLARLCVLHLLQGWGCGLCLVRSHLGHQVDSLLGGHPG